jgi:hypothetical protein
MASQVRQCIVGFIVVLLSCPLVFGAGTTAANFLKIIPGARAAALGGAYTAMADDASAIYWNPAALSYVKTKDVSMSHNLWLQDIQHSYIAAALPISRKFPDTQNMAFGMAFTYLSVGGIERRSANTTDSEGTFGAADSSLALGASYRAFSLKGSPVFAGVSLLFIRQSIDSYSASGMAATFSLDCKASVLSVPVRAAMAVRNLGPAITFVNESAPLPLVSELGLSLQPLETRNVPLTVACGLAFPNDSTMNWSLGAEYVLGKIIAFRAGYARSDDATRNALSGGSAGFINSSQLAQATGFSAGFGISLPMDKYFHGNAFDTLSVDYAFVPFGDLGNAHRISLGLRW